MVVMDGSWIYNYLCNLRCEIYSIKHYVIKLVSDLRQVGGFLRVLGFPPPIKHDLTEILLKMVLNTITITIDSREMTETGASSNLKFIVQK